jgi:ATP-binding cassette subfamily G (WHITE) protein 2
MNEIAKTMSGATERSLDKRTSFIQYKQLQNVTLEWKNLTYQLWVGKGKNKYLKTILNGVSGAVPSGRLVAVMAPTGGGKTSLINALAGRAAKGGILSGEIIVNGAPRDRNFRGISAYVMQDDLLFANLTVRETLEFAAKMRLPREVSDTTKKALMEEIIRELGLTKAENTFIGNEFKRGVSGGERKRTNIAIGKLQLFYLVCLSAPLSSSRSFPPLSTSIN